jgi:hypothetical protein
LRGGMADSEDQAYFGIDILLEKVGEKYEQIKVRRRLLFGRLKEEGSKLDPEQKRKLRRLWRKMNKEYKRLVRDEDSDEGYTEQKMEQIMRPWTLYFKTLIEIYSEISNDEEIRDVDEGDTIHGMDWEKEKGDSKEDDEKDKYTVRRLFAYYEYRRVRCEKIKLFTDEQEKHGFKEKQSDLLELVQCNFMANQEAEKFENIYINQRDHEFTKSEFNDYRHENSTYLRLMENSYSRAKHFAENKSNENTSHVQTGKQMKTSLTGLLNQLKTENTRAR